MKVQVSVWHSKLLSPASVNGLQFAWLLPLGTDAWLSS